MATGLITALTEKLISKVMGMATIDKGAMDFYDWLRIMVPVVIPTASVVLAYLDLRSKQKKHRNETAETVGSGVKEVDLKLELAIQQLTNRITSDFNEKHQENQNRFDEFGTTLRTAIAAGDEKIDSKIDKTYRDFGETITAQRERLNQFEIYLRDNYVSKRDLDVRLGEIRSDTREINTKLGLMQTNLAVLQSAIRNPDS